MSECIVYGLYVIFNSTLYDEYYRILNGSTQVNSTEIIAIPVPDLDSVQEMGRKLMKSKDVSERNCNTILEEYRGYFLDKYTPHCNLRFSSFAVKRLVFYDNISFLMYPQTYQLHLSYLRALNTGKRKGIYDKE